MLLSQIPSTFLSASLKRVDGEKWLNDEEEGVKRVVPLSLLPASSRARVVDVKGGYGFRRRLFEMGLTPDTIIEVLANSRGPILVRARGAVIAIGRGMAHKIFVEPL